MNEIFIRTNKNLSLGEQAICSAKEAFVLKNTHFDIILCKLEHYVVVIQ